MAIALADDFNTEAARTMRAMMAMIRARLSPEMSLEMDLLMADVEIHEAQGCAVRMPPELERRYTKFHLNPEVRAAILDVTIESKNPVQAQAAPAAAL